MTAIGTNFGNELHAAGVLGLPFAWTADGEITYGPAITPDQKTAIEAVLAAHNPAKADPNAEYAALIAAGCAIVSTGTPALNGTYSCDDQSRSDLQGLVLDALVTGTFPTGVTFPFPDMSGTAHAVTPAQLQAIGGAIASFVVQAKAARGAALAGGPWSPPSQPVTIA